ncbi:MAG: hypothetical protein ACI4F5_07195 [Acutalibacteraceae bacterium]
MSKDIKAKKRTTFSVSLLAVSIMLRFILFLPESAFGISFVNLEFSIGIKNVLLIVSLVVFSVLLSLLITEIYSLDNELMFLPCLFICADTFFFMSQTNVIQTVISDVWLLYMLLMLKKKKDPKQIFFVLLSFISVLLQPAALFSFIPLVIIIKIMASKEEKLPFYLITEVCVCIAAYIINIALCKVLPWFDSFISFFSAHDCLKTYNIRRNFIILMIPVYIALRIVTYMITNANASSNVKKKNQTDHKTGSKAMLLFAAFFITAFGAVFFKDERILSTIFIIVPAAVTALVFSGDKKTKAALMRINDFFNSYKVLSFSIILLFYIIYLYVADRSINVQNFYDYASNYI